MDLMHRDGRALEYLTGGDPDGFPLLFHYGTPCAARVFPTLDAAVRRRGLRLIGYSRPGYGASSPRPWSRPDGPRLGDDVEDAVALLDGLGVGDFLTMGWSGGGPRAIACAALAAGRCRAAASLAGPAPPDAAGLDWEAGMDTDNQEGFRIAQQGAAAYDSHAVVHLAERRQMDGERLLVSFDDLLTPSDRKALSPEYADWVADTFRYGAAQGVVGARDDAITEVSPWGFDPATIDIPVIVWHGRDDTLVPPSHGAWLAARIPTAVPHLGELDGHFAWVLQLDDLLTELAGLGGV